MRRWTLRLGPGHVSSTYSYMSVTLQILTSLSRGLMDLGPSDPERPTRRPPLIRGPSLFILDAEDALTLLSGRSI